MADITLWGFDGSTHVRTVKMLLAEKHVSNFKQIPLNVLKGEPKQANTWHVTRSAKFRFSTLGERDRHNHPSHAVSGLARRLAYIFHGGCSGSSATTGRSRFFARLYRVACFTPRLHAAV
jgi:hypothetical protein